MMYGIVGRYTDECTYSSDVVFKLVCDPLVAKQIVDKLNSFLPKIKSNAPHEFVVHSIEVGISVTDVVTDILEELNQ